MLRRPAPAQENGRAVSKHGLQRDLECRSRTNPDAATRFRHLCALIAPSSPRHNPGAAQEGESMSDQPTASGSLEPLPTRALMSLPTVKLIVIALLIGGLM